MFRPLTRRLDRAAGGPARRQVIVTLAAVLALDSADMATIGTSATQLQHGLHIGVADIGLLLSISSLVGAAATVPAGILVDRVNRTRLLAIAVATWGGATAFSGTATSFTYLLLTRLALGVVVAAAGPAIASLIGDFFPESERGRVYGLVLAGELVGAAFGFLVSGQAAQISWRAPFLVLALPSAAVCWAVFRLPEPARGGASRIPSGAENLQETIDEAGDRPEGSPEPTVEVGTGLAHEMTEKKDVEPRKGSVLRENPRNMSIWQAVRYVVRVRTNLWLIIASGLSYFFFSGVRGFAFEFAKKQYDVSQGVATVLTVILGAGALVGTIAGGRLADRLLGRGHLSARVVVPGIAVLVSAGVFVPALLSTEVFLALPLLTAAALALGMADPPLDAARLDIIHPGMWGRAESVRSILRSGGSAAAPLLFGLLAQTVFGGPHGLRDAFLVLVITLPLSSLIVLVWARPSYPHDVAAVTRSWTPGDEADDCDPRSAPHV